MTSSSTIWGAHWLGRVSLWGDLSTEMAGRWGQGEPGTAMEPLIGQARNPVERLGLAALAGIMSNQPAPPGSGLFCDMSLVPNQEDSINQPGQPAGLIDCSTACRAARHYGLAGPWLLPAPGVAGGINLIARARESLTADMPRAICLAASQTGGLAGGDGDPGGAAALGLQAGQGQGAASLGRVELGDYAGPMDSGAQADFLEQVARKAKGRGPSSIAAVVMNQPLDLKWQASLDAAARRVAPRARRFALPVEGAGQAGGLMLVMAAMVLDTPRPESSRLVLAGGQDGRAAALMVGAG